MIVTALVFLAAFALTRAWAAETAGDAAKPKAATPSWRGVHLLSPGPGDVPLLKRAIAEALEPMGVNVIVLEVGYRFEFTSHPELRGGDPLTKKDAQELARFCREHKIRLIPSLNCLGHQSWAKDTFPLLVKYPEFDETPKIPLNNPGIYCRSWCPLHPKVNEVVFGLMDDLIDAFEADAFHVGMDEVFLIGSDQCERCKGKNPAELFAHAVNDYHKHLVGEKKVEMLMWGDRLLDDAVMKYSEWDASRNGTAAAIDMIPKDIIVCDWHYGKRDAYPSVPYFQKKGFRVWPSSWQDKEAAALLEFSRKGATEKMLGQLCTTWFSPGDFCRALLADQDKSKLDPAVPKAAEALRECMKRLSRP